MLLCSAELVEWSVKGKIYGSTLMSLIVRSAVSRPARNVLNFSVTVADLYVILYDSIMANPETGHGRNGYYFGENGEHRMYDVSKEIARLLVKAGKSQSAEPTPLTEEESEKLLGVRFHSTGCIESALRELDCRDWRG